MRKRAWCFICTMIVCTSLAGCRLLNGEQNNTVESKMEAEEMDNPIETGTDFLEDVTETKTIITPLPNHVDMNNLDNCTVAVSFGQGDAYVDNTGAMQLDVTVYTYDLYDMVDIASLKEGDTIVIRGQEVKITSLERADRGLLINGGLDENGYEFRTDESTVWYECGYSDMKSYYEVGKTTIRVSADMKFYDNCDPDKGEIIFYPGDFLVDCEELTYHFVPHNTGIVIENGKIIKIYRNYMP